MLAEGCEKAGPPVEKRGSRSVAMILDTSIWVNVERGRLAPADVADRTGDEPVDSRTEAYHSPLSSVRK